MERLTKKDGAGYRTEAGAEALLERLGRFEDLWEHIVTDQEALPGQLEPLRSAGKTRSYQFRELMGRKLNNAYVLDLFRRFRVAGG